jgi:cAMP-specific phosphodiesterase 4
MKHKRRSCTVNKGKKAVVPAMKLEDFGMSQETYMSWSFNPLPLSKGQRCQLTTFTVSRFHDVGEGFINSDDDEKTLRKFVQAVEREYLANPFHNFAHAADVCHGVTRIMNLMASETFLTDLEQFALLIGAVGHDLGHPGVNNPFLTEVGHTLALLYNDRSPLENMHCAKLYNIISNPDLNVFNGLAKDQYRDCRKYIIDTILHTDMMGHQSMQKDLQMMYQMNAEVFLPPSMAKQATTTVDYPGVSPASLQGGLETEIFCQPENKSTLMNCILHSADVSNPCRSWDVTQAWAFTCIEEFFAQGDQEKILGIPVQFLNDRDKLNRPNSQIGFIEFMIAPFFAAQIRLFTAMHEFGDHLASNIEVWEELWASEVSPGEEERAKAKGRVARVKTLMEHAKERID